MIPLRAHIATILAGALLASAGVSDAARAGGGSLHFAFGGHPGFSGHHGFGGHRGFRGGHHGRGHPVFGGHRGGRHGFGGGHRGRFDFGFGHSGHGHGGVRFGHHGGGDAAAAIAGFGAGLLLYHTIDRARSRPAARTTHAPQPVRQPRLQRRQPAPPPVTGRRTGAGEPQTTASAQSSPQCLQEREYTTTVTIGGQEREAYGTACLTPDGSWHMGPPTLEADRE